jgi:hypothetical protein
MSRVDTWWTIVAVAAHVARSGWGNSKSANSVAAALDKLARIARTLHRLDELACNEQVPMCDNCANGTGEPGHGPRKGHVMCHQERVERLVNKAARIGTELWIVVSHQGDPRGPALRLWADHEDGKLLGCMS